MVCPTDGYICENKLVNVTISKENIETNVKIPTLINVSFSVQSLKLEVIVKELKTIEKHDIAEYFS